MVVRALSAELQKIAEEEINEVPDQVQRNLEYIKDWLSKQPHITARTVYFILFVYIHPKEIINWLDDQWLLAFLRGCKFSLERTKEKLDLFYSFKKLAPEFFDNRDPLSPEIQAVLNAGIYSILPRKLNESGPTIMVTYSCNKSFPEDISIEALMKVMLMSLEILYMEDDNCTIAGLHLIADPNNFSYKYATQLSASFFKKTFMCMENVYPTRIKAMLFVNAPSFFVTLYNTFKFLLTEKLANRLNVYPEGCAPSVYRWIPISILPKEFGGEGGAHGEYAAQWKHKIESYRDWFLEDTQYGTDETKRIGKPKFSEQMHGVDGSFRKLNVD